MRTQKTLFTLILGLGLVVACNETGSSSNGASGSAIPTWTPTPQASGAAWTPTPTPPPPDNLKIHSYSIAREKLPTRSKYSVLHHFVADKGADAKYRFVFIQDENRKEEAFVLDCNHGHYCKTLIKEEGGYKNAGAQAFWTDRDYGRDFTVEDPRFSKLGSAYGYEIIAIDYDGHESQPLRNTGNGEIKPGQEEND